MKMKFLLILLWTFTSAFPLKLRMSSLSNDFHSPMIALTREVDENEKLLKLLPNLNCVCIPCIRFQEIDEEVSKLTNFLKKPRSSTEFDSVVLTSPQSASVFIKVYDSVGRPDTIQVISVGKGTSKPLIENKIKVAFEPSEATGKKLAEELPTSFGSRILYPGSALAETTLQKGLEKRGFHVTKLNTYTTVEADWSEEQNILAKQTKIVTFASPSTIKIWKNRVGNHQIAVVIGPTSEKAAREAGFKNVFSPAEGSKGIEAWAKLIKEVARNQL